MPVIASASPSENATIRTSPKATPVERDRREQDDERGRAREDAARDADGEQAAQPGAGLCCMAVRRMVVVVTVVMIVAVRVRAPM